MLFTSFTGVYTLAAIYDNVSRDAIGHSWSWHAIDELYLLPQFLPMILQRTGPSLKRFFTSGHVHGFTGAIGNTPLASRNTFRQVLAV